MQDIRQVVRDYVVREYLEEDDERVITNTTPLISSGIVDSFSMVSLKRFLEQTYGVHIPDAEASSAAFDTVERIALLVERVRARGGVPETQPAAAATRC